MMAARSMRALGQQSRSFASKSVGFVGLGAMGSGMAANLAKGGAAPKVWDMADAAIEKAVGAEPPLPECPSAMLADQGGT